MGQILMMQLVLKMKLLERPEPQYELAARAGMSETRLSRIIRGRIQPTAEERKKLAEVLGVPEAELFPSAA